MPDRASASAGKATENGHDLEIAMRFMILIKATRLQSGCSSEESGLAEMGKFSEENLEGRRHAGG
jgi:hypothetical protein